MTNDSEEPVFDPYSAEWIEDPYSHYAKLRETCPVHHHALEAVDVERINANPLVARPTTEFWQILRYDDCAAVLQDASTFASGQGPGPERLVAPDGIGMLIYADEPHHTRQRRIVTKALSPRMVNLMSPRIQELADTLIDGFVEQGGGDVMSELADPLSIGTMAEILGVPASDRELFKRWADATVAALGGTQDEYDKSFEALLELSEYFMAEIERRRRLADAGADLPDDLLTSMIFTPYEERQFNDMELIMACQILIVGGTDTTASAIGNAVHLLCTHPAERAKLEADWSLLEDAMEECLRYDPPVQGLFRNTARATEISGCPIPEDAKVRVLYASANRDRSFLEDAEVFRVDRDPKEIRRHLSFSFGIHACLGSALGRLEMRTVVRSLFQRLPGLELDPEHPPRRSEGFFMRRFDSLHIRSAGAHGRLEGADGSSQDVGAATL